MKIRILSATLISLIILVLAASATPLLHAQQESDIRFGRLSLEQGLSHGTVFSIVQDQTGFMWFGTPSGLNKYDGYNITVYQHNPDDSNSLSNDNAGNLFIDSSGIIWIGTWGGGLNRLDPRTDNFTRYLPDPLNPHSISSDRVQTIFEDSSGIIWVGTSGGGLNRLDQQTGQFKWYQNNPADPNSLSHDRIWRMAEDKDGFIWIATSDGLNKFDPQTETFTVFKNDPNDPGSLSHSLIRTLYIDKTGTLWVGTESGLNRFNPQTRSFTRYLPDPYTAGSISDDIINAIFEDSLGDLWVGTSRGGLNKLNRESETFSHYVNDPRIATSLSYNDVRWITEDHSGVLWVATRGGGVNKFAPAAGKFGYIATEPNRPNSLNNNDVRAILKDTEGNLWIGTKGGGLNRLDTAGNFTSFQHDPEELGTLSHNDVYALYQDSSGILWVGTSGGGLNKFDPQTGLVLNHYQHNPNRADSLSSDDVNSIYGDPSGMLWIGTKGGGLNKFNPQTGEFIRFQRDAADPASLSNNDVYGLHIGLDGALWVSTYGGGLNKLSNENLKKFIRYQNDPEDPTSLSNDDVYAIYQDINGLLWIGTANGGLNKFNPQTGESTRYTQANGLYSDFVYGILGDQQGNLWLSTSKGLSKFNPQTGSFINYDASDGLESVVYNEGAYHQSPDGEMFFGGINGLIRFYPDQIEDNPHPPQVVLTGFSQPDAGYTPPQPVDQLSKILLPYQDNTFTFEFSALDYTNPVKNRYAYKLEGFDKDWVEAGTRRFATYTNLDPGTYTFRVKAANNAGIWNDDGAAVVVTVTPPFWETWWFRLLAVGVALAMALGVYKLRTRNIKAQARRLQQQVDERTAELSQANQRLRTLNDRLQHELNMARAIQLNLLPPSRPNWPGLDVLCYSTPAREVGGDFYAYHAFTNPVKNYFAVAVGDVSGKGMPAALLMAVGIASFQSNVVKALPPAQLLAQLDESLVPYTRTGLENCALCYIDIHGDTLRAANAGCVTPLIRRKNGATEWIEVGGMPLGVGLGAQDGYSEVAVTVAPGDLIVLTSDGVIEAMAPTREIFGFGRLEQAVATGPQHSAEAMLSHLRDTVLDFVAGIEPHDDLTLVVVQV
jgi:ligand-binding sensor domain-containing protein/serine phosphatase RsbU (regulator of sigma subunit)